MSNNNFIPVAKPLIQQEEHKAVERVMLSGMLAQGKEVKAFEDEFADSMAPQTVCVAVNSGTSALHLGLLAAGIGPDDEVIVPSFTFAATANSVALTGATPVFADIELETYNLDPVSVEEKITDKTRAIMPVHLYGLPANMPALTDIASRHGLLILEDAAQAHLASIEGQKVGTFGLYGAFSLYPTKNMTSGEGGMVSTFDENLAQKIRLYRNQGMEKQYANELVGYNNRMTDLHAAIGRAQLSKIEGWTKLRKKNAKFLNSHLEGVITPTTPRGFSHVYHQYTIRINGMTSGERKELITVLKNEYAIGSGVYYPVPCHRLTSLEHFGAGASLPVTDKAAEEVLSLPVYPSLEETDLERIVRGVNNVMKAGG